jgi:hypothetical protein
VRFITEGELYDYFILRGKVKEVLPVRPSLPPEWRLGTVQDLDLGMFTEHGNAKVQELMIKACESKWSKSQILDALCELSRDPMYGEASDTFVTDNVFATLFREN